MNKVLPNLIRKKSKAPEGMLGPSHWLHEISLPKRVPHHFWPGLIPLAKKKTTYQGEYFLCKRSGILKNKTPTTGRGLSKRFFGVDEPL